MTQPNGSTITRAGATNKQGQVWMPPYGWVQPVKDQRGNLLYYSDPVTGQRLNPGNVGPGSGQMHDTASGAAKAADERTKRQTESTRQATVAAGEQAWIDGHLVSVVRNADGSMVITPVEGGESQKIGAPSTFDALDGTAVDEKAQFLMGMRVGTGQPVTFGNLFSQLGAVNKNIMTIRTGVAWLAELSTKDPGAYQAMLDKLHNAGYLADADYSAAAGHWSSAAGTAFAKAARDVSVVNTTTDGQNTDINTFLDSKKDALANGKSAAYTPVDRTYTDPEYIKGAAKSAAEDALGRQLTPDEEAKLTARFHGLEDKKFDAIDATRGQGGASVTSPEVSGQVDAFVSGGEHEQEAANYRAAKYGLVLKQMFGLG